MKNNFISKLLKFNFRCFMVLLCAYVIFISPIFIKMFSIIMNGTHNGHLLSSLSSFWKPLLPLFRFLAPFLLPILPFLRVFIPFVIFAVIILKIKKHWQTLMKSPTFNLFVWLSFLDSLMFGWITGGIFPPFEAQFTEVPLFIILFYGPTYYLIKLLLLLLTYGIEKRFKKSIKNNFILNDKFYASFTVISLWGTLITNYIIFYIFFVIVIL